MCHKFTILLFMLFDIVSPRKLMIAGRLVSHEVSPYTVSIASRENGQLNFICSGSLIGPDVVLTAAHCIHGVSVDQWAVIVSTDDLLELRGDEKIYKVKSISHPGFVYDAFAVKNDIALLFLSHCVSPDMVKEFATLSTLVDDTYDGKCIRVNAVGFGKSEQTSSHFFVPDGKLRGLSVPQSVHSGLVCKEAFMNAHRSSAKTESSQTLLQASITSKMGCYGGDALDQSFPCSGDSGGGVVADHNGRLIGVTSFSSESCGTLPNYFTKVGAYSEWILSQIEKRKKNQCSNDVPLNEIFDNLVILAPPRVLLASATISEEHIATITMMAEDKCKDNYVSLNNLLQKGHIDTESMRLNCRMFLQCISNNSAPSTPTDMANEFLNESLLDDSTGLSFETKRAISRLLMCTSTYELYYDSIRQEMNTNMHYMSSIPPSIDCPSVR